jgi:type I restriction enzyme S subunit
MSWEPCKIGDLLAFEYGRGLRDYQYSNRPYPVFGTNGQVGTSDHFLYDKPSLIIGRKGAYRGVHYSNSPFYVIDTAFYSIPKNVRTDIKYLYYWFLCVDINSMDSGSAIPSTSRDELYELDLDLPPLPEQRAIASVLSSLDDKIDLLHRQNKTLEAMAETLFRQWFVEEASEDWEEGTLGEVVTITRGSSPRPIMDYVGKMDSTVPWIKIADATGSSSFYIDSTREFLISSGVPKSVEVFPGDLILSNSATCGLPYFVEIYGCIHDGWLLFRDFDRVSKYFVFFFLKQIHSQLNLVADGSVQNNLNTNLLKSFPLLLPPSERLDRFNATASQIIEGMKSNLRQIRTLEKLRDTLLPKLMSGEVRVQYD